MEATTERPALLADSRRTFRLLHPRIQLRLPLYVPVIGLGFGLLMLWNAHSAFADLMAMVLADAPASFADQLREQSVTFALVCMAMLLAYALVILGFCVGYTHRLLGPTVALKRQIHSLKNGNCRGRVQLRQNDGAFLALADELNELTHVLAQGRRDGDRSSP